MDRMTGEKWLL